MKGYGHGLLASDIEKLDELVADLFTGLLVRPDGQDPGDLAGQTAQIAVGKGLMKALDVVALGIAAGIGVSFLEGDPAFALENEFPALLDIDARVHPADVRRNSDLLDEDELGG